MKKTKERWKLFLRGLKEGFNMFKDRVLTPVEKDSLKRGAVTEVVGKILGLCLSIITFKVLYDIIIALVQRIFGTKL